MKPVRWTEVAELVGLSTIIVGLILVYAEIRQNGTIARAQLSESSSRILIDLLEQEREKDFALVLAKSFDAPHELTSAERRQMNAYLRTVIYRYYRERYYYRLGLFETWDDTIPPSAPYYFGNGYGRTYWEAVRDMQDPELAAAIDTALENSTAVGFWRNLDSDIARRLRTE